MKLIARFPSLQAGTVFGLAGALTVSAFVIWWMAFSPSVTWVDIAFISAVISAIVGIASGAAATLVWRTVIVPSKRFSVLPSAFAGALTAGLAGGGLALLTFVNPFLREPMAYWLPSPSQMVLLAYVLVSPVFAVVGSIVGGLLARHQGMARASRPNA